MKNETVTLDRGPEIQRWSANWHMEEFYKSPHGNHVTYRDHRAHVTRLQAEVERLKDRLADANAIANLATTNLQEFKEDHQSELAKARELLRANAADFEGIRRALAAFHKANAEQWCGYLDDSLGICLFRIKELAAFLAHQSAPAAKCSTCDGSGTIDDGEITCSDGGIPFENGPVKCVKDCPECAPAAKDGKP